MLTDPDPGTIALDAYNALIAVFAGAVLVSAGLVRGSWCEGEILLNYFQLMGKFRIELLRHVSIRITENQRHLTCWMMCYT